MTKLHLKCALFLFWYLILANDTKVLGQPELKPYTLVNIYGDTIPTGISIPLVGDTSRFDPQGITGHIDQPVSLYIGRKSIVLSAPIEYEISENISSTRAHDLGIIKPNIFNVEPKISPIISERPEEVLAPNVNKSVPDFIQQFDIGQGLKTNNLKRVATDKSGNIWVSTDNYGVIKYNGETFTSFNTSHGLPSNNVVDILVDRLGRIWFSTLENGIICMDGQQMKIFSSEEGLPLGRIWSLYEDNAGDIWAAYLEQGAFRYNGQNFEQFGIEQGLTKNNNKNDAAVSYIFQDSKGNHWFGCWGAGVNKFDGKTFTHFTTNNGLVGDVVNGITEDTLGNIWVATWSGLSIISDNSISNYTAETGLPENRIRTIYKDEQNRIWLSFLNNGVAFWQRDRLIQYGAEKNSGLNNVLDILVDENKNIWMATPNEGLQVVRQNAVHNILLSSPALGESVGALMVGQDESLWMGLNKGLARYNQDTLSFVQLNGGKSIKNILDIHQSADHIWVGTNSTGLYKLNDQTYHQYLMADGLASDRVRSICHTPDDVLWVGHYFNGLDQIKGDTVIHYSEKMGLGNEEIYLTMCDTDGDIWFCSKKGIGYIKNNSIKYYTTNEGLPHNRVYTLLQSSSGIMWAGTQGGLAMQLGDTWIPFTSKDGFSGKSITSILEDNKGHIWFATEKGVHRIDQVEITSESKVFKASKFGDEFGVFSSDFLKNIAAAHPNGQIWWGGNDRIVGLQTDSLSKNSARKYNPTLDFIQINGSYFNFRNDEAVSFILNKNNDIHPYKNLPVSPMFSPKVSHLQFNFTANDLLQSSDHVYQYMLKGVDDNWQSATRKSSADYRNLGHGKYNFKVRILNPDDRHSEIYEYPFQIKPPFWLSTSAKASYLLLFAGFVFWIIQYRSRVLVKRNQLLEEKITVRTSELKGTLENLQRTKEQLVHAEKMASLGQLSAGIAHEINNPINFISNNAEALKMDLEELESLLPENKREDVEYIREEMKALVSGIVSGSERINKIVKGMNYLSHQDNDRKEITDIHKPLESALSILANSIKNKTEIIKEYTPCTPMEMHPAQINQVFLNILNNALHAIEQDGQIWIRTYEKLNAVCIEIEDSGVGMSKETIKKIFDPFYTTKDVGQGTGLGLSISIEIITAHNGDISVESEMGRGTKFIVRLPF